MLGFLSSTPTHFAILATAPVSPKAPIVGATSAVVFAGIIQERVFTVKPLTIPPRPNMLFLGVLICQTHN